MATLAIPVTGNWWHGQKAVATAGTEVALAASQALFVGQVTIKAWHANAGMIYVGKNPVTLSTGYVLDAGEVVTLCNVANLVDVYVDASVNGEGVSFVAS